MADSASSNKWEKFEDEDDEEDLTPTAKNISLGPETEERKAIEEITGCSSEKQRDCSSSIENGIEKSTPCEDVETDSSSSGKLQQLPDPLQIASSDRDVVTTPKDRGLSGLSVKEDEVSASGRLREPTTKTAAHSDLEKRAPSETRYSPVGGQVADNKNELKDENKKTKWTTFNESSGAELNDKSSLGKPQNDLISKTPHENMASSQSAGISDSTDVKASTTEMLSNSVHIDQTSNQKKDNSKQSLGLANVGSRESTPSIVRAAVNGDTSISSKQSNSVRELSALGSLEMPSLTTQGSSTEGETKSWVSFGEEGINKGSGHTSLPKGSDSSGGASVPSKPIVGQPDGLPPISTDLPSLNAAQQIPTSTKIHDEVPDINKGMSWITFDEKGITTTPPVAQSQPATNTRTASESSSSALNSWVTFDETKSAPKIDLTNLTINVGLPPQASPAPSTPSPNPFVNTTPPQGVNPFKPSQNAGSTNPFKANGTQLLPVAGQMASGIVLQPTVLATASQQVQPPIAHNFTLQPSVSISTPNAFTTEAKGTDKAVTTVDELNGIVAASAVLAPTVEEEEAVKAEEHEILEEFPVAPTTNSWSLLLRFPDKKKRFGPREWKPVVVKLEGCTLHIYEDYELSAPFREVPLQGYFAFSIHRLQSHEQGGKVHTVKLEYVKYKESRKLRQKGNIEHIPCTMPILKIGSPSCCLIREFIEAVTNSIRFLPFYRDRGITYRYDEVFVDVDDVCDVLLAGDGAILKQGSKVVIKVRAFLTGDPECQLVLNDAVVKKREEERLRGELKPQRVHHWINVQQCEFHKCVDTSKFEESHAINFHPLDACTFELLRFQVKNTKPLPLEVKASLVMLNEQRIELKAEIQLCQEKKMAKYARNNVVFRFPIPETWVPLFRKSKVFGGEKSIKSTRSHKAAGIKSRLRNSKCSIVVSLGSAKYEPEYSAVVWRIEKLPFIHSKVPVDAPQTLVCRLDLPHGMECPASYEPHAEVEYDVSYTLVSDTTIVAIKVSNENLPEKWTSYRASYRYHINMDVTRSTSSPVRDVGCTQQ